MSPVTFTGDSLPTVIRLVIKTKDRAHLCATKSAQLTRPTEPR